MNRKLVKKCLRTAGHSFELTGIVDLSLKEALYRNKKFYGPDEKELFVGDEREEISRCLESNGGILRILYLDGKVYCRLLFTVKFDCDVIIAEFMRDITGMFYVGDMPREGEKDLTQMLHGLEKIITEAANRI